jgi:hypothetical protein
MKYIKYFSLMLGGLCQLAIMAGCKKDFLDRDPKDQYTNGTFWKSADEVQAAIKGCYTNWESADNIMLNDCLTDNAAYVGFGGISNYEMFASGTANSSTDLPNLYDYKTIYTCNWFLENVDRVSTTLLNDVTRKQVKAEARFLRAYRYFVLSQYYRNVPLEMHTLTQQESRLSKPASQAEIRATIINELAAIAPDLPLVYGNVDKGRATRGAALALKARVELYAGKYTDCVATCNQLMTAPFNYTLYPSFENLFRPAFEAANDNREVILDIQCSLVAPNFAQTKATLNAWAIQPVGASTVAVTQSLVDAFETSNGKTIQNDGTYNSGQPYQNRDPRLDATVIRPGLSYNGIIFDPITPPGGGIGGGGPFGGGSGDPFGGGGTGGIGGGTGGIGGGTGGTGGIGGGTGGIGGGTGGIGAGPGSVSAGYTLSSSNYKKSISPKNSPTGYNFKKYLSVLDDYWNTAYGTESLNNTGGNVIVMRYAEVLLMYAEAKIEAGQIDQSVYNAINQVRQRVNMPLVTASTNPTQASLRDLVRRERRVELAGEGLRWFDIVRWNIGSQVIGNVYDCLNGSIDPMGNLMLVPNSSTVQLTRQFSTRYNVFPFNPAWLQANKNLVQNTEYQ